MRESPSAPLTAHTGSSSEAPAHADGRRKLTFVAPWIVAAALIGYVFSRVPVAEAWSVARTAQLEVFIPLVLGAVVTWFLLDSSTYAFLFSRFNAPVSFREALSLRGMSYLLTPIHWNLGMAAIVLRLRQTKKIPLLESTSSVMLFQAIDGIVLAALATTGLSLLASQSGELAGVRFTTTALVIGILFNIALLRITWPNFRWLSWYRTLSVHHAHRRVEMRDILILIALKTTYHSVFVLVTYFGTRAFGIELPFALALAATPIIQAVGGLPITPAGLGTQQAAMLYFFGERFGGSGSEAAIVAFGFSLPVALILGRCLLGVFYLRDLSRTDLKPDTSPGDAPTALERVLADVRP